MGVYPTARPSVEPLMQALDVAGQQVGPARSLLPDCERRGVLQMGTLDLDHISERLCLGIKCIVDTLHGMNNQWSAERGGVLYRA